MKLTNRRFLNKQHLELLPSSSKVKKENLFDSSEFEISYENIHNKKKIQISINNNLLFLAFFSGLIGLFLFLIGWRLEIWIRPIVVAIAFFVFAILTKKRTITISSFDGNDIELFFNSKDKASVNEFSGKIIESSNNFLLGKYGKIDKAVPVEGQLNNLLFLRDREIITEVEFENLKNQLFGRESKGYLGFQ